MTTVEKLLAQIFERKKSIIEQVDHQADLYKQHLVYKCLIEGITPPSWLWNPNTSDAEGISELTKEELISKILCTNPQSSARCSFAHYPGYDDFFITGDNNKICGRVSVGGPAFSKGLNKQDDPTVPALSVDDHAERTLNCVPELHFSVTSPEDRTDERILNIQSAPDQPIAEIKRSKSRQKALKLRSSAKALSKSDLGYKTVKDVDSSQIRFSLLATEQEGQNEELPQSVEHHSVGGECCEEMNMKEAYCTSRETGKKAFEFQGCEKATTSVVIDENIRDVIPSQIRVSLPATDQLGHNDKLSQSTVSCSGGEQSFEEMNLDEADYTSGKQRCDISKDDFSSHRRFYLSSAAHARQNDELDQSKEPCAIGGQNSEEMNLDEENCISREQRCESADDVVSSQIGISLLATNQAGQNDRLPQFVAEPQVFYGECCEEMNFEETDFAGRDIGEKALELQYSAKAAMCHSILENINDVGSNQTRFCLHAADQAGQVNELQLTSSSAVDQSVEEMNLNEADYASREMEMDAYSDMVTRSRSCTEVPVSVKGSLTLACKNSDSCHVAKARRTESMPISHSEHANSIHLSKSVGPSDNYHKRCGDWRVDGVNFPIKDKETNVCTDNIGSLQISRERQNCGSDSSRDANSCDNYERVDIAKTDSSNILTLETADGSLVEVNLRNVHNEDHDTRRSISEDSRRYSKMDTLSSQHNTCPDAVSDSEMSSLSAKVDEEILASSSGVSTRQAIGSIEASELIKPSVGFFRRLTRSQTRYNEGCDTRILISEDSRKYNKRGTLRSCRLSQQYTPVVAVSDPEASSFSTKVDAGIHASSSGVSARHIDSMEASVLVKPCVDFICQSTNSQNLCNEKETWQPVTQSSLEVEDRCQLREAGSSYKENNENKNSLLDVDDQQLEVSHVSSLPLLESRNSQEFFVEAVRTSHSGSNPGDSRMPGSELCSKMLRNLEKCADNVNSENLKPSDSLVEGIRSPKQEDGLHTQHTILSPGNEDMELANVNQSIPVFIPTVENFTVDSPTNIDELNIEANGIHCDELSLRTTLERASILAEMCRSASLDSSYQFSPDFEFQESQNMLQPAPNGGNLEHLDLGYSFPSSSDVGQHVQSSSSSSNDYTDSFDGMPYSVSLAYSGARFGWNSRNQYPSPVGVLWDRPSSYSGSSEKRLSSNPELTCFPIEEDPSGCEESRDDDAGDMQEEINLSLAKHFDERKHLKDLTNLKLSVSAEEEIFNTESVHFSSTKITENESEVIGNQTSCIGTLEGRTNKHSRIGANRIKAKNSTNNCISKSIVSHKTSLKGHNQKLSLKESKRSNIVLNVTSFVPLVQQKQATTACTGKRVVTVKALEAAEAAKRLDEKKENERKLRKETIKLMREKNAKLEEKNLRNKEIEKKKKEEERKKKDADIVAKKRQREEDEMKDKEKKRMRLDAKLQQMEKEEKKHAEKADKERENHRSKADRHIKSKESHEHKKQQSETTRGDKVALQTAETKSNLTGVMTENGECSTSVTSEAGKAMDSVYKSPRKEDMVGQISRVQSYEISPYQCSDDEDGDEEELPTKKSIPSWASKTSVAMFLPLQQKLNPDVIFPFESFCCMNEVMLRRKTQQSQVTK